MGFTDSFEMKPREAIIREVRRFPLIDGGKYFVATLLMMIPFFFLFPLLKWNGWGIALGSLVFATGFFIFFRTVFLWYHNVFVVTTDRIVDFEQRGFFERVVSQSSLEKIQDVSLHTHGALQTVFLYGDVNIKTAWGSVDLCVPAIFRPGKLQRLLLDTQEIYMEKQRQHQPTEKVYARDSIKK
jgi:hypothetical protein